MKRFFNNERIKLIALAKASAHSNCDGKRQPLRACACIRYFGCPCNYRMPPSPPTNATIMRGALRTDCSRFGRGVMVNGGTLTCPHLSGASIQYSCYFICVHRLAWGRVVYWTARSVAYSVPRSLADLLALCVVIPVRLCAWYSSDWVSGCLSRCFKSTLQLICCCIPTWSIVW